MAIIYTSRNLSGSYSGYTNGSWGSLMNSYAVRFTPGAGGQGGGAFEGSTFYFSGSVYFPRNGVYTVRAAADNSGTLNVAGVNCSVAGFGGSSTTTFYSTVGTKSVSGSVYNAFNGPSYATNPYGIAFTIEDPPIPNPPTVSLSANPSAIIQGNGTTLTWSASGQDMTSFSLTNYSNPGSSGSYTFYPTQTTTYTYIACNEGGCRNTSRTVTVYIPPVLYITAQSSSIIAGQCTTISWYITGDGSTVYWTSGGISNGNVTSSEQVCPSDTTTYAGYVTGLGGTSPSTSVTVTVYQIPTIDSFDVPDTLNYGQQGNIICNYTYANISATLSQTYFWTDLNGVPQSDTKPTINLTTSGSAELTGSNTSRTNTIPTDITYDNYGPRRIEYTLTIQGNGGSVVQTKTTYINIDEIPDNLLLAETNDLFKDQAPVYTPITIPEEIVESELYLIDGIDIPVEIKCDYPIQVDVNKSNLWRNVREI